MNKAERHLALAFGRVLKEQRLRLGLTQEKAAAQAGMKRRLWSSYETGHRCPTLTHVATVTEPFNIDPVEFSTTLYRYRDEIVAGESGAT